MREPFSVHTPRSARTACCRLVDRLLRRPEREHARHRPEDLLLRDTVALRDVREHAARTVVLLGQLAGRLVDLRALVLPARRVLDLVELLAPVDRPTSVFLSSGSPTRSVAMRCFSFSIPARRSTPGPAAATGAADVALVEVDAVDDSLDGLVERTVVEDDVAALPPSSSVTLSVPASRRWTPCPHRSSRSTRSSRCRCRRARPVRPSPVTMLTIAGGSSAWRKDVAEEKRRQRRRLGRLEHDRVARSESRRESSTKHQHRKVPRDDLSGDADRLGVRFGIAYSSLSAQPA